MGFNVLKFVADNAHLSICDAVFKAHREGYNQALEEYKEQILYNVSLPDSQLKVIEQVCERLKK